MSQQGEGSVTRDAADLRSPDPQHSDDGLASRIAERGDRAALSPEEAAISREEFDRLLHRLPAELQPIFIWKLQAYTNAEIGRMIGRTERTVELKMKIIRKTLERAQESRTGDEP
jgi:DNA-directed RNA polymerase specialized sigma24 family protein